MKTILIVGNNTASKEKLKINDVFMTTRSRLSRCHLEKTIQFFHARFERFSRSI